MTERIAKLEIAHEDLERRVGAIEKDINLIKNCGYGILFAVVTILVETTVMLVIYK